MESKQKLKQIVKSTIISSNNDTRELLSQLGKSFLTVASTNSLLDLAVSGYRYEYAVLNLLNGKLWDGNKFNSRYPNSGVIVRQDEIKLNQILDAVNLFWLHIQESYGEQNLKNYLDVVILNYEDSLLSRRMNITKETRIILKEILSRPVWNFLLVLSIFSSDFAGIPTRGESSETESIGIIEAQG